MCATKSNIANANDGFFCCYWQEIEAREKMVRHMWDVYVHNPRLKMTSFWQEAFRAAFEELESEVPGVRDIAKMSLRSIDMDLDTKKLVCGHSLVILF